MATLGGDRDLRGGKRGTAASGYAKITADGDCSHEIKRCLLLGRKVMINFSPVQFSLSVVSDSVIP